MEGKKPLCEIADEFMRLQMWMEEEGSDQDQSLIDTFEMVKLDFKDKADGYGSIIRNLEAHVALIKAEEDQHKERIKELAAYRSTIEHNIENFSKRLLDALIATGQVNRNGNPEYKTDYFRFGARKSSSVVITAENVFDLPDECLRYKDPEPDKTAIKDYLAEHPDCEWAHIETKVALSLR